METVDNRVNFFTEDCIFLFEFSHQIPDVLNQISLNENVEIGRINYIFCSDAFLLEKNKQFLNHDYFTDVITFDYSDEDSISGDIFISIDNVTANSQVYNVTFENELFRVMIHGALHLVGYGDSDEEEQKIMRSKEDFYLSKLLISK
jgi:rRNA maturation RNase YbeY